MSSLSWRFDSGVMGASLMTVSVGYSGAGKRDGQGLDHSEYCKATFESVLLAVGGAMLTKSYWPLLIPPAYLIYERIWDNRVTPSIDGEVDDSGDYGSMGG